MKLFIGSLLVLSLVILFLFALFPSEITVSRVVQINKPPADVLKKIDDLREWKNWNDFLFAGYAQNSVSYAHGEEDSIKIVRPYVTVDLLKSGGDTVITRWRHDGKSFTGKFVLSGMNRQTILEWTLRFHVQWYPWDKLASMFYDKNLGPLMEKSLMNLKNEMETPLH
ncbi:MAG TPA: SRPBCC family protein [Puia sp.]